MKDFELKIYNRDLQTLLRLTFALSVCSIVCFSAVVLLALQPKGRVSCADFGSYTDALAAYRRGATWLDANHNGTPCEALYKNYRRN